MLDRDNNIVYASPMAGSSKAYLVSKPLSISFKVEYNSVVKVLPEVLKTLESTPEDFGYATFGFDIAETFDFLLGAFIYDNTTVNFSLTTAQLKVTSNSEMVYEGALKAYYKDASISGGLGDSLGVTNKITLPERYSTFTVEVSKLGYGTYNRTFSKEDLRKYYSSVDKGPLVVVLERLALFNGLVAYYKLDNNANDLSGMENNGSVIGNPFKFESGTNWYYNNNGSANNYIEVPNNASLNMLNAITIAVWINTIDYVGAGHDPIVTKPYYSHANPYYQYSLGMAGNYWSGHPYTFGFTISIGGSGYGVNSFPTQWTPGNWYYVVATYDGSFIKIFVNGVESGSTSVSGKIDNYGQNAWIGHGNNGGYMRGGIDEVRIYNRALSQEEITSLYQE